ncbi:MAG: hypothetical protein QOH71_3925 [Blastocatellia bacterium]|jgi:hypothetical protein|nr:hypothetical protein [Blastocatellia bacterium]
MEVTDAGGAALAIGIWYQSLGAAAALTPEWNFRPGIAPKVYGDANGLYEHGPLTVLLEYFDMDSAVSDDAGKWFVQFKAAGIPTAFCTSELTERGRSSSGIP